MTNPNERASAGYVWQCICGKTSPTKSGWDTIDGKDTFVGERGWDISCFLNCVQIEKAVVEAQRQQKLLP